MISAKEARDIYNKAKMKTTPFGVIEREIRAKSENCENEMVIDNTYFNSKEDFKNLLNLLNKKGYKITKSLWEENTYYVEW